MTAKIWDINVYCLEEIHNNSNKSIDNINIIDGFQNVQQNGQESPKVVIKGSVYGISNQEAEIQKNQIFGLCTNYYKNRFLIYIQNGIDSINNGWYKISDFSISQKIGHNYFPFDMIIHRLNGQPSLFWSSVLIYNEYLSSYQYFISLCSGQSYVGSKFKIINTQTGNVSISIENSESGQFVPSSEINPVQSEFYNGQCLALDRFRMYAGDNTLYRVFQPHSNVEQINNGLIAISWEQGQLKILIWDTIWKEVCVLNLLMTEIEILQSKPTAFMPMVFSYDVNNVQNLLFENSNVLISPIDDGVLGHINKPFLCCVDMNQVCIETNVIVKDDITIKDLEIKLIIKKGLPLIWIEFRTGDKYGLHHGSNLEIIGDQIIINIENENESDLPSSGLQTVSRWAKATLNTGIEVGLIWTRLKQDHISDPAYPQAGNETHLILSRLTNSNCISRLGIFALMNGHPWEINQLAELFYGNSETLHTII